MTGIACETKSMDSPAMPVGIVGMAMHTCPTRGGPGFSHPLPPSSWFCWFPWSESSVLLTIEKAQPIPCRPEYPFLHWAPRFSSKEADCGSAIADIAAVDCRNPMTGTLQLGWNALHNSLVGSLEIRIFDHR